MKGKIILKYWGNNKHRSELWEYNNQGKLVFIRKMF